MAPPTRLLYVDDEPALLEIGKIFLEKDGDFSVTTVDSAPSALALLKIEGFDTIISDYQMPGMDGIEFLKQLKASGNTTPFIIFTGRGREEIVIQALNEGADFYLQKGGEPRSQFAELAHKIRLAVEQRRAAASIRDHERREADIINFLPDATFAIDTQGIVIAWNRAMEKMTGVKSDQILGKGNYEYSIPFYHERRPILIDLVLTDDPVTSKKYPDILRDGTTLFSEITIPHFNNGRGAELWFTASPLYNTLGRIVGAIESIREITAHKQIEEALAESEMQFRDFSDLLPQIVYETDTRGNIKYANHIAFELFGYSDAEFRAGLNVLQMLVPGDRERAAAGIRAMVEGEGKAVAVREYQALRKNGSTFPISIYLSPVLVNNQITGLRGIILDITDTKQQDHILKTQRDLSLALQSTRGLHDTLETCLKGAIAISGMDAGGIYLVDGTSGSVDLIVSINLGPEFVKSASHYPHTSEQARLVMAGKPVYLPHIHTGTVHRVSWEQEGLKAAAVIPVHFDQKVVACLNICSHTIDAIPENARVALETVATQIGAAIDRNRKDDALVESEQRYRSIVNDQTALIARFNPDGVITFVNEAYRSFFAPLLDLHEIEGKNFRDIMQVKDYAEVDEFLRSLSRKTPVREIERMFTTKDGKTFCQVWSVRALFDTDAHPVEYQVVGRDITVQKMTEVQLRHKTDAIEASIDGIAILNNDQIFTYMNRAHALIYGYDSPADLIGKSWQVLYDAEELERFNLEIMPEFSRTGQFRGRARGMKKDASTFPQEISLTSLSSGSMICVVRDMTQRTQIEDALRQVNQKLKLLSGITRHDISNQILALDGFIELLHTKNTEPSQEEYITRIKGVSSRISSMIRFTREYEEIGTAAPAWQDCHTHIKAAVMQAPLGQIKVINDLPAGAEIFADPLIARVYYNLMDNAARYGGKITTIRLFVQEHNGNRIIVCEDDGDGIPAAEKTLIFNKGFGKNTGMGLFLTREILSITGITIRETGEPGKGARFEIEVPKDKFRINKA